MDEVLNLFQSHPKSILVCLFSMLLFTGASYFVNYKPFLVSLILHFYMLFMLCMALCFRVYIKLDNKIIDSISSNINLAMFVGIFIISVFSFASQQIAEVYKKIDNDRCLEITFTNDIGNKVNSCDLVLIGANSNYIFFLSKENNTNLILQKETVVSISETFEKRYTDYPIIICEFRKNIINILPKIFIRSLEKNNQGQYSKCRPDATNLKGATNYQIETLSNLHSPAQSSRLNINQFGVRPARSALAI